MFVEIAPALASSDPVEAWLVDAGFELFFIDLATQRLLPLPTPRLKGHMLARRSAAPARGELHRDPAGFAVEVVEGLEAGDQAEPAEEDLVRARVVRHVVRVFRAERQVGEALGARAEAMGDPRSGRAGDDVAPGDRMPLGGLGGRREIGKPVPGIPHRSFLTEACSRE
jgi:hypothetical protein